jgi:hypothetical protein
MVRDREKAEEQKAIARRERKEAKDAKDAAKAARKAERERKKAEKQRLAAGKAEIKSQASKSVPSASNVVILE